MPVIAVNPLFMTNSTISVASDDYAAAVSSAVVTPTTPRVKFKGLKPTAIFNLSGAPEWTFDLVFAQDLATATSLWNYLWTNVGQTKTFTFQPVAGGKTVTISVTIEAAALGGQVDTIPTSTVSLPVNGQPTLA